MSGDLYFFRRDRFSLKLSCRGSDLDNARWDYDKYEDLKRKNQYLIIDLLAEQLAKEKPKQGLFCSAYGYCSCLY